LPPGYYPESNHLPLPFFLAVLLQYPVPPPEPWQSPSGIPLPLLYLLPAYNPFHLKNSGFTIFTLLTFQVLTFFTFCFLFIYYFLFNFLFDICSFISASNLPDIIDYLNKEQGNQRQNDKYKQE